MTIFRKFRGCMPNFKGLFPYCVIVFCLIVIASYIRNPVQDNVVYSANSEVVVEAAHEHIMDLKQRVVSLKQERQRTTSSPPRQLISNQDDGYRRASFLRNVCTTDSRFTEQLNSKERVRVSYDDTHNALFCPLCKMASTFWTRVYKMIFLNRQRSNSNLIMTPFDVPIAQAPASHQYLTPQTWKVGQSDARDSFRFLFIRNPYAMLFSAYVDKIVGPNPTYWKTLGQPGIKLARQTSSRSCGSDLTFSEFLQFIVYTDQSHHPLDCHVAKYGGCQPCATNYTYVAKMETFKEDAFHILSKLDQNQTLEVFNTKFSALHADDAIDDSISGPFLWKRDITLCMSWPNALRRIWRKLQIRGVIGASKFPLTDEEALTISKEEFKRLVIETGQNAPSSERSEVKRLSFIEAYKSVPSSVSNATKNVYWQEFILFDYDDKPAEIFDRSEEAQHFGLFNYSNINEDIDLFS